MALDKEALAKEARKKNRYQFVKGNNKIRLLPPSMAYFTEAKWSKLGLAYSMHYRLAGYDHEFAVPCPKTWDEKARCPICEMASKLKKADYKEQARDISRKTRYILNIAVFNKETNVYEVQILEIGGGVYNDIRRVAANPEYTDPLSLTDGFAITIGFAPASETASKWNEFTVVPSPKTEDITVLMEPGWEEKIDNLEKELPEKMNYEQVLKEVTERGFDSDMGGTTKRQAKKEDRPPYDQEAEETVSTAGNTTKEEPKIAPATGTTPADTVPSKPCFASFSSKNPDCKECPNKRACVIALAKKK